MKEIKLTAASKNLIKRGESVTFTLGITYQKVGITHKFTATILKSTKPVVWEKRPSAFYETADSSLHPVSNDTIMAKSITFGTGELERQSTYPFVLFLVDGPQYKNDRIMFTIPITKQELLNELTKNI